MNIELIEIKKEVYDKCAFQFSEFENEVESTNYEACHFKINGLKVICRNAKTTPKKIGQFVTFWKRNEGSQIEPFFESDNIDFYVVNVQAIGGYRGQFVFPKSVLIKKGIISTSEREGKRAFRVYPMWDVVKSKQAERTQKWQLNYFYKINQTTDLKKVVELYAIG